jgi:hypothetical protein
MTLRRLPAFRRQNDSRVWDKHISEENRTAGDNVFLTVIAVLARFAAFGRN